jgi:threonine dehydratase
LIAPHKIGWIASLLENVNAPYRRRGDRWQRCFKGSSMFTFDDLDEAASIVRSAMPPTPQYAWPLLAKRFGCTVVVKHENHTPIGAFKVRGGLVYLDRLRRERPHVRGIISATRGNHGQSLALAASHFGLPVTIVVPQGNSAEKNAAMQAFGAELVEHGRDFDDAKHHAARLAEERSYEFVPSFHKDLVTGVATYARELFEDFSDLDVVYAPIGLGSGITGLIRTRDLLGLKTEIVGVVPQQANAYRLSFDAGRVVPVNQVATFADGAAVRVPDDQAFALIEAGAARVVEVAEDEIAEAIRTYHEDTHNLAEGAGALALAALANERDRLKRRKVGVVLSGGNIDRRWAADILAGGTPRQS